MATSRPCTGATSFTSARVIGGQARVLEQQRWITAAQHKSPLIVLRHNVKELSNVAVLQLGYDWNAFVEGRYDIELSCATTEGRVTATFVGSIKMDALGMPDVSGVLGIGKRWITVHPSFWTEWHGGPDISTPDEFHYGIPAAFSGDDAFVVTALADSRILRRGGDATNARMREDLPTSVAERTRIHVDPAPLGTGRKALVNRTVTNWPASWSQPPSEENPASTLPPEVHVTATTSADGRRRTITVRAEEPADSSGRTWRLSVNVYVAQDYRPRMRSLGIDLGHDPATVQLAGSGYRVLQGQSEVSVTVDAVPGVTQRLDVELRQSELTWQDPSHVAMSEQLTDGSTAVPTAFEVIQPQVTTSLDGDTVVVKVTSPIADAAGLTPRVYPWCSVYGDQFARSSSDIPHDARACTVTGRVPLSQFANGPWPMRATTAEGISPWIWIAPPGATAPGLTPPL